MPLFALAALLLLSPATQAKTTQVLELQRVNYKPEKKLVYDLDFNPATCEINRARPFDVYYRDNATGAREPDFSGNSQSYFGPRLDNAQRGPREIELAFKGFDEIEKALNMRAEILIRLEKTDGKCAAFAEITYGKKRFTLERIEILVTKVLGIPNGVEWVLLKGRGDSGRVVDCVAGDCTN